MDEMPNILLANEAPERERYVMECKLTVTNGEKSCTFDGFASREVVEALLDIMRRVMGGDDQCQTM